LTIIHIMVHYHQKAVTICQLQRISAHLQNKQINNSFEKRLKINSYFLNNYL
jgi:uncharacterized protein YjiS (DUF1127 family)